MADGLARLRALQGRNPRAEGIGAKVQHAGCSLAEPGEGAWNGPLRRAALGTCQTTGVLQGEAGGLAPQRRYGTPHLPGQAPGCPLPLQVQGGASASMASQGRALQWPSHAELAVGGHTWWAAGLICASECASTQVQ